MYWGKNMDVFRYSEVSGTLLPNPKGEFTVIVEGDVCLVQPAKQDVEFGVIGNEGTYLEKLKSFERLTGVRLEVFCAMAVPEPKERLRRLSRLFGRTFEDYVLRLLSSNFRVERGRDVRPSFSKFTGKRDHVRPDFVVEGIAVEAKVGEYQSAQLEQYSKIFPKGVLTTPFSSPCSIPKGWLCVSNLAYNGAKLIESIKLLKEGRRGERGDRYTPLGGIS